jgi:hypothetical protein
MHISWNTLRGATLWEASPRPMENRRTIGVSDASHMEDATFARVQLRRLEKYEAALKITFLNVANNQN